MPFATVPLIGPSIGLMGLALEEVKIR